MRARSVQRTATALALLAVACAPPRGGGRGANSAAREWPDFVVSPAERPALAAALRALVAALPADSAAACLAFRGPLPAYWYRPDAALLAAVAGAGRPVVAPADCPRTYDSMVLHVDSAGRPTDPPRPPGYVDPHHVDVRSHALVAPDSAALAVTAAQGTRIRFYACGARRGPDGAWRARCTLTGQGVSATPAPARVSPNVALNLTSTRGHGSAAV